jgi:CheY-like chemotaxis protein
MKAVVDLLRPRAAAKALDLSAEFDPRLPDGLIGDPTRLRQVLFNLLGNAIKFTDRGHISLTATCATLDATSATLAFTVTDTGIGMDEAAVARLFNAFSQADSSMSRRFGGTGLGLAISQKLVEAMGGKITAESAHGGGSKFIFTLRFPRPAAGETAQLPSDGDERYVAPALRGRVLVVEDDRINQRVLGHFLKQMGLEVAFVEDGYDAVHAATTTALDAILMDCQLPGIDGLEATRRIREKLAGRPLPIVAITANASTADRTACLAAGMDDFLTKPVRRELLASTLGKLLPAATSARTP